MHMRMMMRMMRMMRMMMVMMIMMMIITYDDNKMMIMMMMIWFGLVWLVTGIRFELYVEDGAVLLVNITYMLSCPSVNYNSLLQTLSLYINIFLTFV
jgi:hypothetical protein